MYKVRLCLGTGSGFGISIEEQIPAFKKAGFDGFFTAWDGNIKKYRELADEHGMIYQSVHAPFLNAAKMWSEEAQEAVEELIQCVKDCAENDVPIMVVHTYIGFGNEANPTQTGIENFRCVVEEAKKRGVKIAFENTEGEEYLAVLMDAFKDYQNVGFCWDTGHELCYGKGKDMTALYGDRLICTHLNDNLGMKDYTGETIIWTDDLHLLPFDGIGDWEDIVKRLNKCGYDDILTFELLNKSKPERHDNDKYAKMKLEEYLAEAYARACKVAALKLRK